MNSPSTGYLWDLAVRKKISLRNYGEFVIKGAEIGTSANSVGTKSALLATTSPEYVGWDLDVTDQKRVDAWLAEFNRYVTAGNLPALVVAVDTVPIDNRTLCGSAARRAIQISSTPPLAVICRSVLPSRVSSEE